MVADFDASGRGVGVERFMRIMRGAIPSSVAVDDRGDVLARAYASFYRYADFARSERELVSYAFRCVRSAHVDFLSSRRVPVVPLAREEGPWCAGGALDVSAVEVEAFLASLSEECRSVATLLLSGYGVREVMTALGMSCSRVERARAKVRAALREWL